MADPITVSVGGVPVTIQPQLVDGKTAIVFLAPPDVAGSGNVVNPTTAEPSNSDAFPGPDQTVCRYVATPAEGMDWSQVAGPADLNIVKTCTTT